MIRVFLILLSVFISHLTYSQCFGWSAHKDRPDFSDSTECINQINWGQQDHAREKDDTLSRLLSPRLVNNDTACFCSGFYKAKSDTINKLYVIGDPGHVSQYIYHKYATKGIQLVMTGDIVRFGQKKYNDGYNSVSIPKIKNDNGNWPLYKPFRRWHRKRGLNDFEVSKRVKARITCTNPMADSVFIQMKNPPFGASFKRSRISLMHIWRDTLNLDASIDDLKKGIWINISSIKPGDRDGLILRIDLSEFKHPNYNWRFYRQYDATEIWLERMSVSDE